VRAWQEVAMIEGDLAMLRDLCEGQHRACYQTLEQVLLLAVEIAREGREGRKVGTLFVVGDADETLRRSRCLILDPLQGHPDSLKRLDSPGMRETIKELAQLDGGFIVSDEGVVLSACRHLDSSSAGIDLPLGLGSRHMAAASITKQTRAVAVAVSESSVVRLFVGGQVVADVVPENWQLRRLDLSHPQASPVSSPGEPGREAG
jgi:DNA integrity scanning protein DisA with diadenylate cyclase activity